MGDRAASRRVLAIASGGLIVAGLALLPTAASAAEWPNTPVDSIPIPQVPVDVAFDPAGETAFVATDTNTVEVVDVGTRAVTSSIAIGDTGLSTRIEVDPAGDVVLVSNTGDDTVSVIDTQTLAVTGTIDVGDAPTGIAFSPDGSTAYVANGDGTVSVIDVDSGAVRSPITVGGSPELLALSPDGSELWVPGDGNGGVSVVDTSDLSIVTSITGMPEPPAVVEFAPDGSAAFVGLGEGDSGGVARVDTTTRAITDTLGGLPLAGTYLSDLIVMPDGETLFAVSFSGSLTVVDAGSLDIITQTVDSTLRPGARLTPGGDEFWVAVAGPGSVEILEFRGPSITTTTLPDGIGGAPYGPATVRATNPSTLPVALSSPDLPSWLTLDPATGTLSGTPPATGATYSFTVVATDTAGHSGSAPLSILVRDPLAPESLAIVPSDSRVLQGATISLGFEARLYGGGSTPIDSGVTFSSDVPSDVLAGRTVTFRQAGTHTITAQWGGFSSEAAIVVIPVVDGEIQWPDTVVDVLGPDIGYADVAVSPDSATAYVTRSGALDVLDTATGTVRASVTAPIAGGAPAGVEVSPDGSVIAVGSGGIVLVDAATLVATTVTVDGNVEGVAFSPDGSTVFAIGDALWIIDLATADVTDTIPVSGSFVTITPDGGELWASGNAGISVVDLANETVATIPTTVNSRVAITPDGSTALTCDSPSRLAFIDVESRTVTRSIAIAGFHEYCAMSFKPGGHEAYFVAAPVHANQGGEGVGVALLIDVDAATIADTIPYTGFASGLALAPDGSIGYIAQFWTGGLAVLEYGGPDPLTPAGALPSTGPPVHFGAATGLGFGLLAGGALVGLLARARRRPVHT